MTEENEYLEKSSKTTDAIHCHSSIHQTGNFLLIGLFQSTSFLKIDTREKNEQKKN